MNGIESAHRTVNDKYQNIIGVMSNTSVAQIRGLSNIFEYFDKVRPGATSSTTTQVPFELDNELMIPSSKSNKTFTQPFDVTFVVTVSDAHSGDDLEIANTMVLHASVNSAASKSDYPAGWSQDVKNSLPEGVFVGMDIAFYDAQLTSLGTSRKHLNDTTVIVNSIMIKV